MISMACSCASVCLLLTHSGVWGSQYRKKIAALANGRPPKMEDPNFQKIMLRGLPFWSGVYTYLSIDKWGNRKMYCTGRESEMGLLGV